MQGDAMRQLAFDFGMRRGRGLDDFVVGGNAQLLHFVGMAAAGQALADRHFYLWGEAGAGKSHLLGAACEAACAHGRLAMVVDGSQRHHLHPEMLLGLGDMDLVCVDDLDVFAGDPAWEEALFHLYNQLQGRGFLMVSARVPPQQLPVMLPDLKSRLGACDVYKVHTMPENERGQWLRDSARHRGFELDVGVCEYILGRAPRELHALTAILDRLDQASLSEQRLVTLPFVRQTLAWAGA